MTAATAVISIAVQPVGGSHMSHMNCVPVFARRAQALAFWRYAIAG